jgi:hypothetical protein
LFKTRGGFERDYRAITFSKTGLRQCHKH